MLRVLGPSLIGLVISNRLLFDGWLPMFSVDVLAMTLVSLFVDRSLAVLNLCFLLPGMTMNSSSSGFFEYGFLIFS